jgi:site-specific recombinase XerD
MKNNSNDALELAKYYNSWIDECVYVNSLHTVRSYESAMNLYMDFLEDIKGLKSSSFCSGNDFSGATIKEWLVWLKNKRGCSPQSCNVRLASIRSYLQYLGEQNIKYRSLLLESKSIHRMKETKKKVNGMSESAVKTLMSVPDACTNTGYRDIVLMAFLYGTAARIDEVLSLKLSDLKLGSDHPHATVVGKGNKIRTLYLPPKLVSHLSKYIKKFHGLEPGKDRYLFYSRVKGYQGKITQEAINRRLKKYAVIAHETCPDVPINIHAHQFRHAKASHLLDDGMNVVQLSKILGHANLSTTMVYLDITSDMQTKAMMTLEDEKIRNIPRKWSKGKDSLTELFGRKWIKKIEK